MTPPSPPAPTGRSLGYIRVSTQAQSLDAQRDAITAAGVQSRDIYADKMSGTRADRPEFQRLIQDARPGDSVTVTGFDRFGRNTAQVFQTLADLLSRDIHVHGLRESVNTATPAGRLVAGLFIVIAQWERELIMERSTAAREARARRGLPSGRLRKLTAAQLDHARALRAVGISVREIARSLGVGHATLYRRLSDDLPLSLPTPPTPPPNPVETI